MKNYRFKDLVLFNRFFSICMVLLFCGVQTFGQENQRIIEYKGTVIDANTGDELPFVNLEIAGTNIATVTNSEGNFLLKLDEAMPNAKVALTYPGYKKLLVILADLNKEGNTISLTPQMYELDEVSITRPKDAQTLVAKVFKNRSESYLDAETYMTAFYREAINKRNRSASLAEAVVAIKKRPYTSSAVDLVGVYKARKSTNYNRLDTLAIKLQGGPLNALYADLIKYPEYFMTPETLSNYEFSFGEPLINDGKLVLSLIHI